MLSRYKIAVIEGDGIGREVVPEGLRVLEAAGRQFGIDFSWRHFDWSCETYLKTGRMMPSDGLEQLRAFDAIYLGAVGYPGVPDHVSLWGLLIPIRRAFEQYVNLRPVRLLSGVRSPVRDFPPGEIDFCIIRENNEGEYSEVGGRLYRNTDAELAVQETVFTRKGCDRIMRFAFELAATRKRHVTSATKSNGIVYTMPFWDERFKATAASFPGIRVAIPTGSMWSWLRTCSAISCLTLAPRLPARSAWHLPRISIRSAPIPRCSSRFMVLLRILRGRALPILWPRSGLGR